MNALASIQRVSAGGVARLSNSFERLFGRLDDPAIPRPVYWAVLASVLAIIAFPYRWTAGEENYFQLAYRWVRPDAFAPFSAAFDQSSGKFMAFWLYGNIVDLLGYEGAHAVVTAASIAFMAFALLRLSVLFRLSVVDALAVVAIYLAAGESLMGGEGFLIVADPKVFCYAFGILAFAEAGSSRGRWALVAIWSAIAVYFHFQIGGLWFALSWLLLVLARRDWRTGLFTASLFIVLVAPEIYALARDQLRFAGSVPPKGMPSADYIYAVLRAPHHLAPFADVGGWKRLAMRGLGYSLVIAAGALYALREPDRLLRAFAIVVLFLAMYQFVAVGLSWLDRETLAFAKFYLFRPAATILLLALYLLAALWRLRTVNLPEVRLLPMTAIIAMLLVQAGFRSLNRQLAPLDPSARAMVEEVTKRSQPSDGVLLDPALDGQISLIRQIGRPTFVTWKFVPTNPPDIYRWWGLMERRRETFAGNCSKAEPAARFLVAIAGRPEMARCGPIVWSNDAYLLIERQPPRRIPR
ncbi:MAG TPA: hypothetical protein VJT70_06395 [Sphingomicrobium sp.]|nr:hypothetical protein [Sphingomicrobium sp.]